MKTHGKSNTKIFQIWCGLRARCRGGKNSQYQKYYKSRGITVSDEWNSSFEAFYRDMGEPPGPGYSIDRIDNNKGYSRENCRWATAKEQIRNSRHLRLITFNGRTMCCKDWSEELFANKTVLKIRLCRGWSIEKALTTPLRYIAKEKKPGVRS